MVPAVFDDVTASLNSRLSLVVDSFLKMHQKASKTYVSVSDAGQ